MKRGTLLYRVALLALTAALCLSGCSGTSDPEELFVLPQPPEDYQNLNMKIEEVLRETGGESIAPQTGTNTQTVQLQDLDGDGYQESAVAFFRVSNGEKPLKIYIFRMMEDDNYTLDTCIEGVGNAINSVSYEDIGGTPTKEVVVSWQISTTDHTLGVYSLDELEGIELLWVDSYTRFRLADLDGDEERELVVVSLKSGEEDMDRAEYYDYDGAAMALRSTVPLSQGITGVVSVRGGYLEGKVPAVFVTSNFGEESGRGQVVDVLAHRDGQLVNVTLNSETGMSDETVRYYTDVSGSDINGDGIMELPRPQQLPSYKTGDEFWLLEWRRFDVGGKGETVFTTYHNVTDGWYFITPENWRDHITISRKSSTSADERAVVFSLWRGEFAEPTPFLTFYKFTGTNQTNRANLGSRVTLFTDGNATYAYEFDQNVWNSGLEPEEIEQNFKLIHKEWSTDY